MAKYFFLAVVLLEGCANVGYKDTNVYRQEGKSACVHDCDEQRKLCRPNDTECQNSYSRCAARCERWSGLRGGDPAVTIDVPK
jgi:hypothetical protein